VLVTAAIGEGKNESHLACAVSVAFECGGNGIDQCVDDEHESLRIGQSVVHPVEGCLGKRPWHPGEDEAVVIGAGEAPEVDAFAAESDFDGFLLEAGEITAGLYADAVEEVGERG
jgi:hypothetical protein